MVKGGTHTTMRGPRILLVIGGGIAAYKSCELVRLIRKNGGDVTCVLTQGGQQFVTPMALAALSENPVHTTLWDLKNEAEMGHIQLSREADLVVVCPATADLMAKMAAGIADDLATTLILATDKPVMAVPAMNVRMWEHEATQRNLRWLREAGVSVMEPDVGPMACGEFGPGRCLCLNKVFQGLRVGGDKVPHELEHLFLRIVGHWEDRSDAHPQSVIGRGRNWCRWAGDETRPR